MPSIPIAVVGAGALFPGSIGTAGFWQNILEKKDNVSDVPEGHWRTEDYYDPDPKAEDKTYARRGAFLPEVDFDALEWGLPPALVPSTDTSQLLALIVAKMVLEDMARGRTEGPARDLSRTSIILGVTGAQELFGTMVSRLQRPVWERSLREMGLPESQVQEACKRIASHYVPWQEASFPGLLGNVVAGRIANRLDLRGTNCVVDAACASSLGAVHLAVNELVLGQSDMVVTGGVDTLNDILMHMCFSKTPALSPQNDCRPFDASADGTLLGEGLGMVALKRLADAERDGDSIYAVLRGLGTSSDGRSKSVYAPVSEGQARAVRAAYADAAYGPETVELVEAHGTATKAGDAAEVAGLKLAFAARPPEVAGDAPSAPWCALGSIKSQVGHTKAAAGAAGLLKIVLALHHKVLPPTIKVTRPNAALGLDGSPFYVNTEARPWIRGPGHPRRASVSAFGFGGSNFHVTCEEYTGSGARPPRMDPPAAELLVYSAPTADALVKVLQGARGRDLVAAAHACVSAFDRGHAHRVALVVRPGGLDDALDRAVGVVRAGKPLAATGVTYQPGVAPGKVAFLFPGQGSQYVGMANALGLRNEVFRRVLDAAEGAVPGLGRVLCPPPRFDDEARAADEAQLVRTEWAQPAIGAVSVGVFEVLRACGLTPDLVAGHSFGELTALHAAGSMDAGTLFRAARARGEAMAAAAQDVSGAMLAVTSGAAEVKPLLEPDVVLANLNAPDQTVIGGPTASVRITQKRLENAGHRCVRLPVATAFHSPLVAGASTRFASWLGRVELAAPRAQTAWSNMTGESWPSRLSKEQVAEGLGVHLRSPVRWVDTVRGLHAAGARIFVEVGPGSILTGLVGRILGNEEHVSVATGTRQGDPWEAVLGALAMAAALGLPVDLAPLWAPRLPLPAAIPPAKMPVRISGTNAGKPWPTAATPRLAPNPERPALHAGSLPPASGPAPRVEETEVKPTNPNDAAPAIAADTAAWAAALLETQRQAAEVHAHFQRTMAESHLAFLRAQEESTRMLMQLAGMGPVSAPAASLASPVPVLPPMPAFSMPPALAFVPPAPVTTSAVSMPTTPVAVMQTQAAQVMPLPPAPAPAARASATNAAPAPADRTALLLAVVAEKTGYPTEMLRLEMSLEADLGIDSIKRVEILSALRDRAPETPEADADTMGRLRTLAEVASFLGAAPASSEPAAPSLAAPSVTAAALVPPAPAAVPAAPTSNGVGAIDLAKLLLEVVADKTGYPAEMLRLEMSLEADLGIDSIKRVEILSALRDRAPETPEADADTMGKLRTLGQVASFLGASPTAAPQGEPPGPF